MLLKKEELRKQYVKSHNYCGPTFTAFGRRFHVPLPRRFFGGVDINWPCFLHDHRFEISDRTKKANKAFLSEIVDEMELAGQSPDQFVYFVNLSLAWIAYVFVSIGGLVFDR